MYKKTLIQKAVLLTLICCLALGASGCGSRDKEADAGAENTGQPEFDVVRLPSSSNPLTVDTVGVAEKLGYFEEQRIKVERIGIVPWAQLIPSLTSDKLDFGSGHINRVIVAVAAGARIKAVAANTLTTKQKPHMTFISMENSGIKSPQDIFGKKVAIMAYGGCNEYTPYEYLKKNNVSEPKDKFEIVVVPAGKEEETMRNGRVDIAGVHDDPANVLARGGAEIIFTDYDIWGDVGGQAPFFASEDFINRNPDLVRRFVTVIGKVNKWINENQQEAVKINSEIYKLDAEKVRANYFVEDAVIKEETVQLWIDILNGYNDLKRGVEASEVYTNEFNPNFKK